MSIPVQSLEKFPNEFEFYKTYWNKKAFVVRNGVPEAVMNELIKPEELLWLSLEEDARSRIVKRGNEQADWIVDHGPFKEELFDTWNDPHEINNLAENPKYAAQLQTLRAANEQWQKGFEDLGMIPETELLKRVEPTGETPKVVTPIIKKINAQNAARFNTLIKLITTIIKLISPQLAG